MKLFDVLYVLVVSLVVFSGCTSEPQPDGDGDGDADSDFDVEIAPPEPPAPPAPPVFTPCPAGWREVPPEEEGGVTTCDPWPGEGPDECADDEAHFPGEPGCTRIGTACPDGDWAEDLPEDVPVLFVRERAPEGGLGTRDSPFGTIAEAMQEATPGTVIALSKGTFDEEVRLQDGVTLWGACVAETLVTCTEPHELRGTVHVLGADTMVRNLRISGRRPGVTVLNEGTSVHLEDVLIEGCRTAGWDVFLGLATGRSVVVRDTRSQESDRRWGIGLEVAEGALVEVTRAVFERNREIGVFVYGEGTTLVLSDVAVRDTQSRESDRRLGRGLNVQEGAQVEVTRAVFERNRALGVFAAEEGTTLVLSDVAVRDTQSEESDRTDGRGLEVNQGAQVEVTRAVFERNRTLGVYAANEGTWLVLSDVAVRDTQSRESDRTGGTGLNVQYEAQVEVTRAVFERNRDLGVFAISEGTRLVLTDVAVRDTQSREGDRTMGRGLGVEEGAQVEVTRAVFERNRNLGVLAGLEGTRLVLTDVIVRDTQSQESDRTGGRGLSVQEGAQVEVTRAVFERNREVGVHVRGAGTRLVLSDVVVRDTQCQESDRAYGEGLDVAEGAQVEVTRAMFERNREVGVFAFGESTRLVLTDVMVDETLRAECVEDATCPGFGDGVMSRYGAYVDVTDFVVSRSARCGVTVHHGTMDLHEGEVSDNLIGACVQSDPSEGFDPNRLIDRVVYRDNEVRLDPNFDMPVPDPALPIDWDEGD